MDSSIFVSRRGRRTSSPSEKMKDFSSTFILVEIPFFSPLHFLGPGKTSQSVRPRRFSRRADGFLIPRLVLSLSPPFCQSPLPSSFILASRVGQPYLSPLFDGHAWNIGCSFLQAMMCIIFLFSLPPLRKIPSFFPFFFPGGLLKFPRLQGIPC